MNEEQERNQRMVVPAEIRELEGKALGGSNPSRSADTALLMLDVLLSHAQELLNSASPAFLEQEQARIRRLKNACEGMEQALVPLYVTGKDNKLVPVVEYAEGDEPIHTDEHPYCGDETCPCGGHPPTIVEDVSSQEGEKEVQL